MALYGLNDQIDLDGSLTALPGIIFQKIQEKLDRNPRDSDWRALIRIAEDKYHIRPTQIELWSPALNGLESAATRALTELSSQGMTVSELIQYLHRLNIDTYPLNLSPYESVTILEHPVSDLEVCENGQIVLEVKAKGHPFPRYQWFFCGNCSENFDSLQGRTDNVLRITKVRPDDAGTYACQIHNCDDPEETKITKYSVVSVKPASEMPDTFVKDIDDDDTKAVIHMLRNLGPFESDNDRQLIECYNQRSAVAARSLITKHPRDVTVRLNDEIMLAVETCGDPPISYQWYRNGQPLDKIVPKLCIVHATPQDFGNYYCVVRNGLVTETSKAALVKEHFSAHEQMGQAKEIVLVSHPKSAKVGFGGSVLFSCEAKCSLPLRYQWFKDGYKLTDETSPEFKLINIQDRRSAGTYQCEVRVDGNGSHIPPRLTSVAHLVVEVPLYKENIEYNPSDKVALLIGNYDYRNEQPLQAPKLDVKALSESFRSLNFKVVSLLNLTKLEIENAVKDFCHLVEHNVYAVFYFCGHGFEENGISYLVPTDAPAGYKTTECVRTDVVLEDIQKKEPPLILMIMDICRKLNKVTDACVPVHVPKTQRGNTVFCYATSSDLNAYETPRRGLLVQHLLPILSRTVGIEALISELKEEFGRHAKHSKIQIPEHRSNLLEPRRSLTDAIAIRGQTQAFTRRQLIWEQAHTKPEKMTCCFKQLGVKVELDFQSDFSNVLDIFAKVTDKGLTLECQAEVCHFPLTVSSEGPKVVHHNGNTIITATTIQDIQKLQSNLTADLVITFMVKGDNQWHQLRTVLDFGMPLVSVLKLWRQPVYPLNNRQPTEQADETDSS